MELNYDCLRETLFEIEKFDYIIEDAEGNITPNPLMFEDLVELMNSKKHKYKKTDIYYSISNLEQAGLIDTHSLYADGCLNILYIEKITYYGHEFIANIRSNNVWEKTKGILSKAGALSIDLIIKVASQVIADLITQNML